MRSLPHTHKRTDALKQYLLRQHGLRADRNAQIYYILAAQRSEIGIGTSEPVRPSVCPSHSRITPKRFKTSKYSLHSTIEGCLYFSSHFPHPECTGSSRSQRVRYRHSTCRGETKSRQIIGHISLTVQEMR